MDPISLIAGGAAGAGGAKLFGLLREHRREPAALSDLLGWGFLVADGVILQKDGSLLTGWAYRGPDLSSATPQELDVLSRHVSGALAPYGDNWMFHVDAVRRPSASYAPKGHFPDPVTALIDEERRRSYAGGRTYFETDYYFTTTYLPPQEIYSRIGRLFVSGDSAEDVDWERVLTNFQAAASDLGSRLAARFHLERMDSDGLARHLHTCLTGLHHPVQAPPEGAYLNVALCDQPFVGGFRPRIGEMHVRPIAVQGFPHATYSGITDFLSTLGFAFRYSSRLIPLSQAAAAKAIRRQQLGWFNKRKGALALLKDMVGARKEKTPQQAEAEQLFMDGHAQSMTEDAQRAASENAGGEVRFCYYTGTILVMEQDERQADFVASELLKAVRDRGFTARVEDVNAAEAFLGTLPGHGYPNLRRPLLSSANIADLLPTTAVWPGRAACPSPFFPAGSPALMWVRTEETTPFRLNLHEGDVGHTLMIGATGAGKSTLAGMLAAQWLRYEGAQVFLFDLGYSGYLLAKAAGGRHYDIAAGRADSVQFQPLARIDEASERSWAAEWLEVLFELQGVEMTPALRARVDRALELTSQVPPPNRTLTELSVQLQSRELKEALRPYTVAGNLGHLLDAGEDGVVEGHYQVFELSRLMELSDKVLVPVLLYLFRQVERRLGGSRPSLIIIEEAWAALMRSLFAGRIKQWLLTLRKENAAVVLVAHSPAQLAGLENKQLVVESCPTRIFLPNPDALDPETAALYGALGLGKAEVEIVGRARKKRDYYYKSPSGSRLFSLGLGKVALSFLGSLPGKTMQETIRAARECSEQHGAAWPAEWLRRRGQAGWAAELERMDQTRGGEIDEDERTESVHVPRA